MEKIEMATSPDALMMARTSSALTSETIPGMTAVNYSEGKE